MDDIKLSETEQRYFSDLYLCCDSDNSGKVTFIKALELFNSGNIPTDILRKIFEISFQRVPLPTEILTRKEFFASLKLIAAHQANVPIRRDLLYISADLPLPRFTWPSSESDSHKSQTDAVHNNSVVSRFERFNVGEDTTMYNKNDVTSTDSEVESQTELNGERLRSSPAASSTASDSPTPTNSIQERSWGTAGRWQGPPCEEQRQLLATEEESSDGEISSEVWSITSEQKEYYTAQFLLLQPELEGVIPGQVARPFFEKSKLPVSELRRIWQLADVTRDGALNLAEFSVAMHLVVLRRNNIALPDTLPESLVPPLPSRVGPQTSSSNKTSPTQRDGAKEWTKFVDSPTSSISSPGPKPVNFDFHKSAVETDPKILHPVAVRVTPDIGSFPSTEEETRNRSPKTSLTVTDRPEINSLQNDIRPIQRPQAKIKNAPGPGAIPPPPDAGPTSLPLGPRKEAPPPPPPRPAKTHARSSSLDLNKLGRSIPPAVPPRASPSPGSPVKRLVNQRSEGDIIPADSSASNDGFADFDNFAPSVAVESQPECYENVLHSSGIFPGERLEAERRKLFAQFTKTRDIHSSMSQDAADGSAPRKHGAFEVYRKPTVSAASSNDSTVPSIGLNKKEMFRRLQEQNATLLRICQELSQELADVREERIALRVKLEQQQSGSG